jgi:hypothetical protein
MPPPSLIVQLSHLLLFARLQTFLEEQLISAEHISSSRTNGAQPGRTPFNRCNWHKSVAQIFHKMKYTLNIACPNQPAGTHDR